MSDHSAIAWTATTTKHELLLRVCDPQGITSLTAEPFVIDLDGKPWRCATDGKRLLLLDGAGDAAHEPPTGRAVPQRIEMVRRLIAGAPLPAWQTTRSALCEWAGTDDGMCPVCHGEGGDKRTCPECNGDGELRCDLGHYHDCGKCDGNGMFGDPCPQCHDRIGPAILPGVLDPTGVALNRALFAGVVQHLPGDAVQIGIDSERRLACLYGHEWRLIVMGLYRSKASFDQPLPTLALNPIGATDPAVNGTQP